MSIDIFSDSFLNFFSDKQTLLDASDLINDSNFISCTYGETDISSYFHENIFFFQMIQTEVVDSKKSHSKRFKKE
jgi:hypothetical protein